MYSSLQKERDSYKEKLAELEKEQITIMEEQTATNLRYLEETRKRDEKLKVAMEALEEIDNNFMCAASTKALRRIRSLSPGPR